MKLKIEIRMDNAAFQDGNNGPECARILTKLAQRVEYRDLTPDDSWGLVDSNGNTVGKAEVVED